MYALTNEKRIRGRCSRCGCQNVYYLRYFPSLGLLEVFAAVILSVFVYLVLSNGLLALAEEFFAPVIYSRTHILIRLLAGSLSVLGVVYGLTAYTNRRYKVLFGAKIVHGYCPSCDWLTRISVPANAEVKNLFSEKIYPPKEGETEDTHNDAN